MCLDADIAAEITLQPIRRFGFDAAIIFADILLVPYGLGQPLTFAEGMGPQLPPLLESGITYTLDLLPERLGAVFQALRLVRAALPADVALIGFAGAPWTVACYAIAGQSGDEFETVRQALYKAPERVLEVIDVLTEATILYLKHQVDAGAEVLQLFESWASLVPPRWWQACVFAPTARIVKAMRAYAPAVPIIGFPKGMGAILPSYVQATGVSGVGVDWQTSIVSTRQQLPTVPLQGNLDPLLLVAGGELLDHEVVHLKQEMQNTPYIFNLGHGIVPQTPVEHVHRLLQQIRS
jgi:uroporphyrinogen decarboxylase